MHTSSSSLLLTDKTTRPIPTIHALYASEMALRQAWRADTTKYQHSAPHTSLRTLQAWWQWLEAWWTEESDKLNHEEATSEL